MRRTTHLLGLAILFGVLAGCSLGPASEQGTAATEPSAANTSEPSTPIPVETAAPEPPQHHIGVRVVDGAGEFFDRRSGETFVPRGNNYVRLAPQTRSNGETQTYHSVFDPGRYSPDEIDREFSKMAELGYNNVRVFLSQNTIGNERGLDPDYMANVADFLSLAGEHDLYVIFTIDWLPGGPYGRTLNQDCCEQFTMMNVHFMSEAGLQANRMFFQDFVGDLIERGAPTEMVLSYQLRNELYFDTNFAPLSFNEGEIQALNGERYDMADPAQKQQMADENLVLWLNEMRAAVQQVDPTALVSSGFFWPQEPNPARVDDPRYINTAPAIRQSQLDFIDLHAYPAAELSLPEYVENFGMQGEEEKPIVMGEFGVSTNSVASADAAATILMDWQVESCQLGFDGWILWTWDGTQFADFYNAQGEDGQIGQALAPVNRPDPCQPADFEFIERNLALDSSVRVSAILPGEEAEKAVDGHGGTQWGAGASPPQWIQIDLGETHTVEAIRLRVAQSPAGETSHQLRVGAADGALELVHTFQEFTENDQVLTFTPDSPLQNIQVIRVTTTRSPSWVAWKEIEVIGE